MEAKKSAKPKRAAPQADAIAQAMERSQSATDYLIITGFVLLVGGAAIVLVQMSTDYSAGVLQVESENYWKSAYPFSIGANSIQGGYLRLLLRNAGGDTAHVTSITIGGISGDWYALGSGTGTVGRHLCSGPGACSIVLEPGSEALITSAGFGSFCLADGRQYVLDNAVFRYHAYSIRDQQFFGRRPVVGTCAGVELAALPSPTIPPYAPGTGHIFIAVNVSGTSMFWVDGSFNGSANTYWLVPNVPEGVHSVASGQAGYLNGSDSVYVAAGQTSYVLLNLTAVPAGEGQTGNLSVRAFPIGSHVFLDGEYKGDSDPWVNVTSLSPSDYSVKVNKSGYEGQQLPVTIRGGENTLLDLTLAQATPTPRPVLSLSGCGNLDSAGTTYVLSADMNASHYSGRACFNVIGDDVVLDLAGHSVAGNNTEGAYGVWTASNGSTIGNGSFSNFSVSIFSKGGFTTVFNNTVGVPQNTSPNAEQWQGIWLNGSPSGNVTGNRVNASSSLGASGSSPYSPGGILLYSAANATVFGNNITASGGYSSAIQLYFSSTGNTVLSNSIVTTGAGDWGVRAGPLSDGNAVLQNSISSSGGYAQGIAVSSSSALTVASNDVSVTGNPGGYGVFLGGVTYSNVSGNTIAAANANGRPVSLQSSSYNSITSNNLTSSGSYGYGAHLYSYSSGNVVSSNNVSTYGYGGYGIYLQSGSSNNEVLSNNVTTGGGYGYGIHLISSSRNNVISGNNVWAGGGYANGVYLYVSSNNNSVLSNSVSSGGIGGNGIRVEASSANNITSNAITVSGASGYGVDLRSVSSSNSVLQNAISAFGSGGGGVIVQSSSRTNTVLKNSIGAFGTGSYGVYLSSTNNIISQNYLGALGASSRGLHLLSASYNAVDSNLVNSSGYGGYGVSLQSSYGNSFSSNNVSASEGSACGVILYSSFENAFSDNSVFASAGVGLALEGNSLSNSFQSNDVRTGAGDTVRLGWVNGSDGNSNNSAAFYNDVLACASCSAHILVNQSSSASFTNVSFDPSKVVVGRFAAFGPNSLAVLWPVDVSAAWANYTPYSYGWVNLSNATGFIEQRRADALGKISGWPVSEYVNLSNATGNFFFNYTPHNFSALKYSDNSSAGWNTVSVTSYPLAPGNVAVALTVAG